MKRKGNNKLLGRIRRVIRQVRQHPKFKNVRVTVSTVTRDTIAKIRTRAPEVAAKIKTFTTQHPDTKAAVVVVGGLTAIVLGKQMIIIGGATVVASLAGAGIAAMMWQPEIALLMLLAAALGAVIKVIGWLLAIGGYIASTLGLVWLAARAFRKLANWWKRHEGTRYPLPQMHFGA